MIDPTEQKRSEREAFASLVLSIRTRLDESQERFARRFDASSSSINKWENCAKPDADRPVDPDNLAISCWEVLAKLEGVMVPELRDRIKGGKAAPPKSISELVEDLTLLNHQFKQAIAVEVVLAPQPINAVAAEFSRSIKAAIAETGLTLAEIAAKYGVELSCLSIVAAGQKVPSYRVAHALDGLLKDPKGRVYEDGVLFEMLERYQTNTGTKKPPQTKRRKTSHGVSD